MRTKIISMFLEALFMLMIISAAAGILFALHGS
jgi:hypothetical protein